MDRTPDVKDVEVVSSTKRGQEAARITVGVADSQQNAAKIALGTGTFCQETWMAGSAWKVEEETVYRYSSNGCASIRSEE